MTIIQASFVTIAAAQRFIKANKVQSSEIYSNEGSILQLPLYLTGNVEDCEEVISCREVEIDHEEVVDDFEALMEIY